MTRRILNLRAAADGLCSTSPADAAVCLTALVMELKNPEPVEPVEPVVPVEPVEPLDWAAGGAGGTGLMESGSGRWEEEEEEDRDAGDPTCIRWEGSR